jgi:hypothetical protein
MSSRDAAPTAARRNCASRLGDIGTFEYRSMVATVAVIQSLVAAVANLDPERTRRALEAYERFVQDQDLLLEP